MGTYHHLTTHAENHPHLLPIPSAGQLPVHVSCTGALGPVHRRAPHLVKHSDVIIYKQCALCFHFSLDHANYLAGQAFHSSLEISCQSYPF